MSSLCDLASRLLVHLEELDIERELGVGRDGAAGRAGGAVSQLQDQW